MGNQCFSFNSCISNSCKIIGISINIVSFSITLRFSTSTTTTTTTANFHHGVASRSNQGEEHSQTDNDVCHHSRVSFEQSEEADDEHFDKEVTAGLANSRDLVAETGKSAKTRLEALTQKTFRREFGDVFEQQQKTSQGVARVRGEASGVGGGQRDSPASESFLRRLQKVSADFDNRGQPGWRGGFNNYKDSCLLTLGF